jgi:hypothetical protein
MGDQPGQIALKNERKQGSILLHNMIEDTLGKISRIVNEDPVIGKNITLVREVTMLEGLVGQMGKFLNVIDLSGEMTRGSTKRGPPSSSSSDDTHRTPDTSKHYVEDKQTAKPLCLEPIDLEDQGQTPNQGTVSFDSANNEDLFQSCEEDEETKEPSIGDILEVSDDDCPYPRKDHYSHLEIETGRNPGWRAEIVKTSSGWEHDTHPKWKNVPRYGKQRYDLPYHRPQNGQSIISLLKNMIGKDLTSFQFPVSFSEPLSMTQRMAEVCQHINILETASKFDDPLERCTWVASFFCSFFGDF